MVGLVTQTPDEDGKSIHIFISVEYFPKTLRTNAVPIKVSVGEHHNEALVELVRAEADLVDGEDGGGERVVARHAELGVGVHLLQHLQPLAVVLRCQGRD